VIQNSDAPPELKSPALSEAYSLDGPLTVSLGGARQVNSIGVGNSDGVNFSVCFNGAPEPAFSFKFAGNGLYVMPYAVSAFRITLTTDAKYVGRLGAGLGVRLPTAVVKEPSFKSTAQPRVTLSGQVIPGAGGYNYRTVSLDCRYKITEGIMGEIIKGYEAAGAGFPYFIDFADESYKLPFSKFYAVEGKQLDMTFQGGVRRYLYSKKFDFEERF